MACWLSRILSSIAYHIQYGDYGPSESEFFEMEISASGRAVISKTEICDIFHIKRFDLDEAVRNGIIPKGRKRVGRKELYWSYILYQIG